MSTISVGETMEIVAAHAAEYVSAGQPDLDERVEALANELEPRIAGPSVNTSRFFEQLFERFDAATIALSCVNDDKRAQPDAHELHGQRVFFAASAECFRRRLEAPTTAR